MDEKDKMKTNLRVRPAEARDVREGAELLLIGECARGDSPALFVIKVMEVHKPDDLWKAFTAHDGCRYGLDGLWVLEGEPSGCIDLTQARSSQVACDYVKGHLNIPKDHYVLVVETGHEDGESHGCEVHKD